MPRFLPVLLCLLLLAGCDSVDDPPNDPSDSDALFSVAVETPSGEPVSGLSVTMEYALVGAEGARVAFPVVLKYFDVDALDVERFAVRWETSEEVELARFVVEGGSDEDSFSGLAEVTPQGPFNPYEVEVEGSYALFRLRVEDTDGSVEYSNVVAPPVLPGELQLHVGFPNPFSPVTTLAFVVHREALVTLEILDLEGRPVAQRDGLPAGYLLQETLRPGTWQEEWRPMPDVPGGVYRARVSVDLESEAAENDSALVAYAGPDIDIFNTEPRIATVLGQTDADGRFSSDDRARFPQLYDGLEVEFRDVNNVYLGLLAPSGSVTIVLRDGAGREQHYERALEGEANGFELTWDPA